MAFRWGIHNFRHESDISEFWIAYSLAMLTGMLFATAKSVEWLGVSPVLANQVQPFFAMIMGTILVITSVLCVVSPIERTVK